MDHRVSFMRRSSNSSRPCASNTTSVSNGYDCSPSTPLTHHKALVKPVVREGACQIPQEPATQVVLGHTFVVIHLVHTGKGAKQ